ncbi:MAG: hypothetical protein GXY50_03225 [Syntrophomonadaceae bacterium]|nr:hypothetical protein [Syntrophomonadaceae bacterium]
MFGKHPELDELGRQIEALREEIPVNRGLKARLQNEFPPQKNSTRRRPVLAFGLVLASMAALLIWWSVADPGGDSAGTVLAADLKVTNQVSMIDIFSGSFGPPVIGNQNLYLPVADQGTFAMPLEADNMADFKKITGKEITFSALSHNGKTAAYVNSRGIYLYDLKTKKTQTLIEGNDSDLYYFEPSWCGDDQSLLITRRQIEFKDHGFEEKSLDIYSINRDGTTLRKLCSGSYASYIPDSQDIVFTRAGNIMIRTAAGEEMAVDQGRFPAPSPDGLYIAYVKMNGEEKELSAAATLRTDLSDVYICSVKDFSDKRKLTANYPFRHTDEEQWLEELNPDHGQQSLVFSGMYSFYNPVWGTDSGTLYVLKGGHDEKTSLRVTRINLSPQTLMAEDTIAHWLQASINRDDDFARSLMKNPSGFLTISNPHPVAYSIIGSGAEKGRTYVDAQITTAYNADGYYSLGKTRFYLVKDKEGYKIEGEMSLEDGFEVLGREDGVYIRDKGQAPELLLKVDGLTPSGGDNMRRLSSLAYSPEKELLLYTIQEPDSFTVHAHDFKENREVFRQTIKEGEAAVMDISFNGRQDCAAIRYFGDSQMTVKLYDVSKKTFVQSPFLSNAQKVFWAGENLWVEKAVAGGNVQVRSLYTP